MNILYYIQVYNILPTSNHRWSGQVYYKITKSKNKTGVQWVCHLWLEGPVIPLPCALFESGFLVARWCFANKKRTAFWRLDGCLASFPIPHARFQPSEMLWSRPSTWYLPTWHCLIGRFIVFEKFSSIRFTYCFFFKLFIGAVEAVTLPGLYVGIRAIISHRKWIKLLLVDFKGAGYAVR